MELQLDIKLLDNDDHLAFLGIIPWSILANFISKNSRLYKHYKSGSFQVTKKNVPRVITILRSFGNESDYMLLFRLWYDYEENYKGKLVTYYKSPEYTQFKADKEIENGKFMLEQSKFEELCDSLSPRHAKIFRCISPIIFDADQLLKLISIENSSHNKSEIIIEQTHANKVGDVKIEDVTKYKEAKKELKQIKEKYVFTEKKCAELESENLKLRNKLSDKKRIIKELENSITHKELTQGSELQKKVDEINDLNIKINGMKKLLQRAEDEIKNKSSQIDNVNKKLAAMRSSNDANIATILLNLDLETLVSYLNSPNEIGECLNSIVKPPSSDDKLQKIDRSVGLDELYSELDKKESKLIDKVINTSINDVLTNKYLESWPDKSDEFYNMKCILSAKSFLISSLYEILRQYYATQTASTDIIQ